MARPSPIVWMAQPAGWAFLAAILSLGSITPVFGQSPSVRTIVQATVGLDRRDGLVPVFLDARGGRVLAVLKPDAGGDYGAFLYQTAMRSGLGSTPVGIDRSNPGRTRVLRFRRVGPRIMAELENASFRADAASSAETQAVEESFPPSIVWAGDIAAEDPSGAVLVDLTTFLTRDSWGVTDALKAAGQGDFTLAADRTAVDVAAALVFPENLEFDVRETFVSAAPGEEVRGIVPEPHAVTLVEHQSLIRLPAAGFIPRLADPRTGGIDQLVSNYGAPLDSPIVYRLAARFRLEKTDPAAARSTVKKPIVFYVDRAAPKAVRDALVEGARWWADAFDAAGFINAFRVEVLPEGVSPLDARYNVISWVHRQTRGWSYGDPITDPRTGEIVKGAVTLGSLRVRQDRMIFEGLVGADRTGTGGPDDPVVVSLARLRQLAVHETGHALGLGHNMAGSTYGDRASVMDYPPPRVGIVDGRLDLRDAYKVGLGDWDRFAIRWLYSEVPMGDAGKAMLEDLVRDGYAHGLRYVRDEDARPSGSANPYGALWDDGPDPAAGLAHVMAVRRIALDRFGPDNIPKGAPLSDLRRVIVPIYLFHRYQIDAAAKLIGGVDFNYGVRGDGGPAPRAVDGVHQRQALEAVLATLSPVELDLPDRLIDLLSTGRDGSPDRQYDTELFSPPLTPVFEIDAAAQAAADIAWGDLFEPSRLRRLADQHARDTSALGVDEVLRRAVDATFTQTSVSARQARLRRVVQGRLVIRLASLARNPGTSLEVAADVREALARLGHRLAVVTTGAAADLAQARYLGAAILNGVHDDLAALAELDRSRGAAPPPGMPIGASSGEDGWFSESLTIGN